MGIVVQAGQRFAAISELQIGEGTQQRGCWNNDCSSGKRIESDVCNSQKIIQLNET